MLEEAMEAAPVACIIHYGQRGQRGCEVMQRVDGNTTITLYASTGLRQQTYVVSSLAEAKLVITLEWLIPTNLGWEPGPLDVGEWCPECGQQVEPSTWSDGYHCDECGYRWS